MSPTALTTRTELPLAHHGTLVAHVTALPHGRVRYVVRAPHVRGTFVVVPEHLRDGTVVPSAVSVQYGDGAEPVGYYEHRPDEPVVYGVRLHGWTGDLDPAAVPDGYFLGQYATSLRDNRVHRQLTSAVRRRTEAVIRAIVGHWYTLPHREALLTSAARVKASAFADHEAEKAARAETECADLQQQRVLARRKLNVILGIARRTPRPALRPDLAPVRLPLVDGRGRPMGSVLVQEVAVDGAVRGSVVYEVTGARVRGQFTVGRDIYRPLPMPEGIWVAYGHARRRHFEDERDHEPTVNGVRLNGAWNSDTIEDLTATTPKETSARVRTSRTTGHSAPSATARRASAVLRALALHYLARPDVEALQLAAAQDDVLGQRGDARRELRELRERHRAAEQRARTHRRRERQYRSLAVSGTQLREALAALAS
ncbi:hypothetical protein [Streptomyces prunicolor]|uniref:hypothetical protein n=1 Tax=Streptomyces prunicolor TaxID=67348 RepID=UPI00039A10A9|nr:hypothetical protein [Streptomyces prunicolor]